MAIENTIGRAYGTIPIEVEIPWQAVATGTVVVLIGASTVKFLVVLAQSSRLNDGHDYFCADVCDQVVTYDASAFVAVPEHVG